MKIHLCGVLAPCCLGAFGMQDVMRAELVAAHLPCRFAWWLASHVTVVSMTPLRSRHLRSSLSESAQLPERNKLEDQACCLAQASVWGSLWQS